jgi:hypothetical protein
MRLPTSLRIMGVDFSIQYLDALPDDELGEMDGPGRVIKINKRQPREDQESTLLHEVLHAVLYLTGQSELLKHKREESLVLAIEAGLHSLYQLRKSNK